MNELQQWFLKVEKHYNVNPIIYAILYFASIPPFWYGVYLMAKAVIKRRKEKLIWREAVKDSIFNLGLSITAFAWAIPVIYLIGWGRNLPWWIYALTVLTIFLFLFSLRKQIERKIKSLTKN